MRPVYPVSTISFNKESIPNLDCSLTPRLYLSSSGKLCDKLSVTCGIKSKPTTSPKAKTPVLGAPIGLPIIASASSTVRLALKASTIAVSDQNIPILLPIKPGVSLQITTSLPNLTSQKLIIASNFLSSTFLSDTISNKRKYLGGLKKCVMKKSFLNDFGIPSIN